MLRNKTGAALISILMALLLNLNSAVADDVYEDNDSYDTATPLAELTELTANQADEDWYRIDVPTDQRRVIVVVLFTHADGDIDVALQRSPPPDPAGSDTLLHDNALVDEPLPAGKNFIWIKRGAAGGDKDNEYRLGWTAFADGDDDGNEPNNDSANAPTLTEGPGVFGIKQDDDWYRIEVPEGSERIDIRLIYRTSPGDNNGPNDGGDIDLELRDVGGTLLASAATTTDHDYISQPGLPAGTYYIAVTGDDFASGYYLEWDNIGDGSDTVTLPGSDSGALSVAVVALFAVMITVLRLFRSGAPSLH